MVGILAQVKKKISLDSYLTAITFVGVALMTYALAKLPYDISANDMPRLAIILVLAIASQVTATLAFQGVNFSVASAVSLAAIPLFGHAGAILVAAAAETSLWGLALRHDRPPLKQALRRLGVNVGMNVAAIFLASLVFGWVSGWQWNDLGQQVAPWLPAAIVADQVNLWLLIFILRLQHGLSVWSIWQDHKWAIPINVLVPAVGGGLLSIAIQEFNFTGVLVFFVPILLSAYTFRMYTSRTKEQMDNLEELVDIRTADLSKANDELAELNIEKDAFLAVLTHDMRTPLTSVKGYASLIRDREFERDQQIKIANTILSSGDALLEIVNNLLEVARIQSGGAIQIEKEELDLSLLISEVVSLLTPQAAKKEITLTYQEVPVPIILMADSAKLRRVITNLVSNAVKYTPGEGGVIIRSRIEKNYAVVDVEDTGFGISADDLPHIFDRYMRVKKHQRTTVGTGLGLSIVKSLVEAHDGEILVESEVDEGSTFTIRLPL
ncbi:MAG: HAMP domain-containing histidine kinase, partial [Chloroflexi bacterium]|nr:HAMP domain-containing histidine kinase [Chloroflexota bacterium]